MSENWINIRISDEIGGTSAISVDDGNIIFGMIDNSLNSGLKINLDFQDINFMTTVFLNAAIGQLFGKYSDEFLQENLKLLNVKPEDECLIKQVIERAKEYFANPVDFEKGIKEYDKF